jgi:hypothetical protein
VGHSLPTVYRGANKFLTRLTSWTSKCAEFYEDFKNVNLPLGQNAHKKLFLKTMLNWDFS